MQILEPTAGSRRDELVAMYQAADVYAFPSLLENFPMVIPEAMASRTAVVSTDAPGCRDLIVHNETGLQAGASDPDDFARQLTRVLTDERTTGRIVAAGPSDG